MKKWMVGMFAVVALVASACGASDSEDASGGEDESTETTAAQGGGGGGAQKFGTLDSPCGEGDYTIKAGEEGTGADKLYIGVGNDRSSTIRPGLLKELYDASVAFAGWCNDQGGIGGLPIEIVDLDAALLNVEAAMTKACTQVFAMVGGGMTQDNLQFSGKDGSDFHKCRMVDIPAFSVSVEKAESNGQVQAIPHPARSVPTTWTQDFTEIYPEESEKVIVVWGELPSLEVVKEQFKAAADAAGMDVVQEVTYPVGGMSDWTPLAQKVIDSGAGTMYFVGEPTNLSNLLIKLKEQGWEGVSLNETNMYDPILIENGGTAVEGAVFRSILHLFEEADEWPAVQQYIDNLETYVEDGKQANLGLQSTSAWLLFATAANTCAEKNDGVLDRECILAEALAVEDWTAGGINGPTEPAGRGGQAASCGMLLVVKDGKFVRLTPELGGENDDVDGFHCPEEGTTEVTADVGEGKVDPDRPN